MHCNLMYSLLWNEHKKNIFYFSKIIRHHSQRPLSVSNEISLRVRMSIYLQCVTFRTTKRGESEKEEKKSINVNHDFLKNR